MELSDYVTSGTWTLLSAPAEIRIINSSEPPYESRTEMVFFMSKLAWFFSLVLFIALLFVEVIQRRALFYTINLIVPTMMISLLSITLFCLPSDAAEKMVLCTSILVALVFFMLLISRILPSTSLSIPLISKYLMFTFFMNLFTVCLSVVSLYLNHHRLLILVPVPSWMRTIFFQVLPMCLFLHKPQEHRPPHSQGQSPVPSPLLLRKIKTKRKKLPKEMNYLIEQFLERSRDIKYIARKIACNTKEMQVRGSSFA
jgi:nicotinic acetylcholine receptor